MPTAEINGIQMHYLDCGSGEPIVLLHGLGSSCQDWEYQLAALSVHYRVIAPSLRGFGETEKTGGPQSVKTWSEDVGALIDYFDLGPVHLFGFSMGGAVSFQLAIEQPHHVRSLIILNSLPSFALDHWSKHMMVLSRLAMARTLGMRRMARYVARRMFPDPGQSELQRRMIERHQHNDRESYINGVQALAGWSVAHEIEKIEQPALILAADQDFTPVSEKAAYVARMRNARLVEIADSRHVSNVDQAEFVNKAVLDFLASLGGRGKPPV